MTISIKFEYQRRLLISKNNWQFLKGFLSDCETFSILNESFLYTFGVHILRRAGLKIYGKSTQNENVLFENFYGFSSSL